MLLQITDTSNLPAIALFSLLVWAIILYNIVASASRGQKLAKMQAMQIKILKEIALKNGVDPQTIEDIINEKRG